MATPFEPLINRAKFNMKHPDGQGGKKPKKKRPGRAPWNYSTIALTGQVSTQALQSVQASVIL